MKLRRMGYACINYALELTTNRTLRLASLEPERVVEVARENLTALEAMMRWNAEHGIHFLRIGSAAIPFASHEEFPLEDWREPLGEELELLWRLALPERLDQRLSMHPGQYCVLNSSREDVAERAEAELLYAAQLLEAVAPRRGTITLHVGAAGKDRQAAAERMIRRVEALPEVIRSRLTLENDDRVWPLDEVLPICEATGLPLVFDIFHHQLLPGARRDWRQGLEEDLERVVATWDGHDVPPKLHISSQAPGGRAGKHADLIDPADLDTLLELMDGVGDGQAPYDLMVEARKKEQAVLALMDHLTSGSSASEAGAAE